MNTDSALKQSIPHLTRTFSLASLLWLTSPSLPAATLTMVPMQGGMVMPMIAYRSAEARLQVMLDPTVPQLTPLMVSHPADDFSPEDPWYTALDPARQGLAFSRRYGFVMDTMTDPLPVGTGIRLRKLAGDADLGAYRFANTAPKAFEPIFGTAGSPTSFAWNGMMFHPTFTAPPGTNQYSATFDAYLAEIGTGAEIANSSTGPFTLTWTTVPDTRPVISIGTRVVIGWPVTPGNWALESTDNPATGSWANVPTTSVTIDGQSTVIVEAAASARVYRLRRLP